MAGERYAEAAELFERLAQSAKRRNMIRQAPKLYLQAGKGFLLAGKKQIGMDRIREGLRLLADAERWGMLSSSGKRVVGELKQEGYSDLAKDVEAWLSRTLPEDFEEAVLPFPGRRSSLLPLQCPSCGGPIRSDEVEWADAQTAICAYCGSGVREER
jgi:hypothetical protein